MLATASAQADANETVTASWNYEFHFAPVPEPQVWMLTLAGLLAVRGIAWRAHRSRLEDGR